LCKEEVKKKRALEVKVMFEPTRLSQQFLEDAYQRLLPTIGRQIKSNAVATIKPTLYQKRALIGGAGK
jgi:hypothetical protein